MRFLSTPLHGQGKWALLSAVALALIVAPFAVGADGDPMRVGAGNSAGVNETRIIAQNVGTYATRQSNNKEGDGGSATYGCRSTLGNEPCLFVFALRTTRAFEFRSRGNEGGRILVFGDTSNSDNNRPFTTNATGVATGLNADEVDGRSAADLQPRVAVVAANGALDPARSRGVASVDKGNAGDYVVNFSSDISMCAYTATITTVANAGAVAVEREDNDSIRVRTRNNANDQQDKPFNLVVNCP